MQNHPIVTSIDYNRDGVQHGFLRLPYSSNDSAWGAVMIPITQIKNSNGPTALITGGNHGDEYEGPIALFNFAAQAEIDNIKGRVILVPTMNQPAFQAGTRNSPIDGLNMNRIFPGKADGTVTEIIADYFSRVLLPLTDMVLDIHSGGKTLEFLPLAAYHILEDKQQQAACKAAMQAFGAPYELTMLELDAQGMYDTQAESMGKVFVSTELGGGGTSSPSTLEIAKRGIENFLAHAGILAAESQLPAKKGIKLSMPDQRSFVISTHTGLLEPLVWLGDSVKAGELIARVHHTEQMAVPPQEYHAPRNGMIIARHAPSLVKAGDCMNVVARVE